MTGDEFVRLTAGIQHALTFSSRTVGEVKARDERHRADNAQRSTAIRPGVERTPEELRFAALTDSGRRQGDLRTGDEDEDFSQPRIMVREDATAPPDSFRPA